MAKINARISGQLEAETPPAAARLLAGFLVAWAAAEESRAAAEKEKLDEVRASLGAAPDLATLAAQIDAARATVAVVAPESVFIGEGLVRFAPGE